MSISSAEEIIPIVVKYFKPNSVIDVGCGIGTWLSVWEKQGLTDFQGVDGTYVNKDKLLINKAKFIEANLEKGFSTLRKFDLVTCLEVAEHISVENADLFINSLCKLGDIILFSAAIPGQEGTNHINEQYPDYWAFLFQKNSFVPVDCLRKGIWSNKKVSVWYRQNIIFYVNKKYLDNSNYLKLEAEKNETNFLNLVHPDYFDYKNKKINHYEKVLKSPKSLLKFFVKSLYPKIKEKFNKDKTH